MALLCTVDMYRGGRILGILGIAYEADGAVVALADGECVITRQVFGSLQGDVDHRAFVAVDGTCTVDVIDGHVDGPSGGCVLESTGYPVGLLNADDLKSRGDGHAEGERVNRVLTVERNCCWLPASGTAAMPITL